MYYKACDVLLTEQDFHDLMYAYLRRASAENVYIAEVFFDPQTHTDRGVAFDTVINGLHHATIEARKDFGIQASLIMCFLRNLSEDAAIHTLEQARPHVDKIIAVGLDSGELGNPPSKFKRVYKLAGELGLKLVAHAGEEGGPEYVYEVLDVLHVKRIDHGVRCLDDPQLVERLVAEGIPLTTCPLSNSKLQVNSRFFNGSNVIKLLMEKGLKVTINSDDPAYCDGYITKNFLQTAAEVDLTEQDVYTICSNAFHASFAPESEKHHCLEELKHFTIALGCAPPPRSISICGSRSAKPGTPQYDTAFEVAKLFGSRGFRVVTGGYYGIMEAGAKGGSVGGGSCTQKEAGEVVGVLSPAMFPQRGHYGNTYLTRSVIVRTLTDRLYRILRESEYFIVFGGTIGTITELMVIWNAAALRPNYGGIPQRIFLWKPTWEKTMTDLITATAVLKQDITLLTFVDSAQEILEIVEKDIKERTKTAVCVL